MAMGVKLLGDDDIPLAAIAMERERQDEAVAAPIAPEDDEVLGAEIEVEPQDDDGQQIPEGQLVLAPERGDHLNVNVMGASEALGRVADSACRSRRG